MSQHYSLFNIKQVHQQSTENEPLVDMVSMVNINPNGRNFISYLRLVDNIPTLVKYWDTVSCIATFCTNPTRRLIKGKNVIVDPETNLEINPAFIERIKLYNDSITELTADFEIQPNQICEIFNKYLSGSITSKEKLILRSFLFLEDTNTLSIFESKGYDIRKDTEDFLIKKPVGSWLIRKSSVIGTDLVSAKVLSFIMPVCDSDELEFCHILCLHVKGYGYYSPSAIKQLQQMPDLETHRLPIPPHINEIVYPCFFDWFEANTINTNLSLFIRKRE